MGLAERLGSDVWDRCVYIEYWILSPMSRHIEYFGAMTMDK